MDGWIGLLFSPMVPPSLALISLVLHILVLLVQHLLMKLHVSQSKWQCGPGHILFYLKSTVEVCRGKMAALNASDELYIQHKTIVYSVFK